MLRDAARLLLEGYRSEFVKLFVESFQFFARGHANWSFRESLGVLVLFLVVAATLVVMVGLTIGYQVLRQAMSRG